MAINPVGGSANLSKLAELYRQQVISGSDVTGTTANSGVGNIATQAAAEREGDFIGAIGKSLSNVEQLDRSASDKAIKAATGDLTDVHDYVIAATQAQVATELTTTVRNKALEAFNDIMRMPL